MKTTEGTSESKDASFSTAQINRRRLLSRSLTAIVLALCTLPLISEAQEAPPAKPATDFSGKFASILKFQPIFPLSDGFGVSSNFAGSGRSLSPIPRTQMVIVTNLNDSGPGSLRGELEAAKDAKYKDVLVPLTVLFRAPANGAIELKSDLVIDRDYVTICGLSAAHPGIQIRGPHAVRVQSNHVAITDITFECEGGFVVGRRYGEGPKKDAPKTDTPPAQKPRGHHITLESCSFRGAERGALHVSEYDDVTISNSMITNSPLIKAYADKDSDKATLLAGKKNVGLLLDDCTNTSLIRNFIGHFQTPICIGGGNKIEIVNNWLSNYDATAHGGVRLLAGPSTLSDSKMLLRVERNIFFPGETFAKAGDEKKLMKSPLFCDPDFAKHVYAHFVANQVNGFSPGGAVPVILNVEQSHVTSTPVNSKEWGCGRVLATEALTTWLQAVGVRGEYARDDMDQISINALTRRPSLIGGARRQGVNREEQEIWPAPYIKNSWIYNTIRPEEPTLADPTCTGLESWMHDCIPRAKYFHAIAYDLTTYNEGYFKNAQKIREKYRAKHPELAR